MIPIKSGGKVIGAHLTAAERKALDIEIQKAYAEYDAKNADEVDAIVLWLLHKLYGFGPKKLKQFHDSFKPEIRSLCERYELTDDGDDLWLCTRMLKDIGVDISEWNKE